MAGQGLLKVVAIGALGIAMAARADIAVAGQRGAAHGSIHAPSGQPPHAQTSPQPPRGPRPTPPVTVPFPNIATLSGPLPNGVDLNNPPRDLYRTRRGQFNTGSLFYPGYAYGGYADVGTMPNVMPPPQPSNGMLRLQVTPGSAQVFVDGYYSGTADDIENQRVLILPEGPHRIEVRARGYAPSTVDIRIPANDVVTYRAALDLERPPAPAAVHGPTTIYVVPGCYMGNVPPRRERVAPGCDISQVRIITPRQTGG